MFRSTSFNGEITDRRVSLPTTITASIWTGGASTLARQLPHLWSSYRANAQGEADALLKPHPVYEALGLDRASRQAAYREFFRYELEPGLVDEIRRATNGNYALGNERFATEIAEALGRRVVPGLSGRPRRMGELESRELFNE